MESPTVFDEVLRVVDTKTKKLENFLSTQGHVALTFRGVIKTLYDFTKEEFHRKTDALPELLIDGFDEEQIWQQLELQNEGEWPHLLTGISKSLSTSSGLVLPVKLKKDEELKEDNESNEDRDGNQEHESGDEMSSKASSEVSDAADEDTGKRKKKLRRMVKRTKIKPSIVDDKFFKLQELDEFLSKEDKKAMNDKKSTKDSDDESVDLFDYYSDDDGSGKKKNKVDDKMAKFKDFFDGPVSDNEAGNYDDDRANSTDEDEARSASDADEMIDDDELDEDITEDEETSPKSKKKQVKFDLMDGSDDEDEDVNETSVDTRPEIRSTLEERQERLQRKIEELEEVAVSEKPWQLKGEVNATARPQNSLLEEHVEFDMIARPAPVITEQTTFKLEDIIRQRIKDKAWDDVEKKFKPVETPLEYKKKLVLDQEKSKLSLAQIYENEYLKQKEALDPEKDDKEVEEPKEHIEIKSMMNSLFAQLDSLANFHYTPKLVKPEIKIVSNMPAINMEEVAPVATSDATLLAPEEIKAKSRGDIIGKAERTETDMKRERRKKKLNQRQREKAKEKRDKVVEKLRPGLGNKYSKEKTKKMIDDLSKDRNITKMDESKAKATKSSTAFFTELQDQVKSHIKSKTGNLSKKKDKNALSAVKLKL